MRSSRTPRQSSRPGRGTGCRRTPRTARSLCYFRSAQKFKTRYATFGFSDKANLDDGGMWPTDYAVKKLTAADEKRIVALVKKAVS